MLRQNKLIAIISLGGAIEYFDFTIYALFATYIAAEFFPEHHPLIALVNTFGIFALGYFARPVGALIFGHFGDRYGRKNSFVYTMLGMSIATLLVGLTPGYEKIGVLAPILLILFRLIQGLSMGGEIAGSSVFLAEHRDQRHRGGVLSIVFAGVTSGNLIAGILGLLLTQSLTPAMMQSIGWRIPFFLGACLAFIGYIIRRNAQESPLFTLLNQKQQAGRIPVIELLKEAPGRLVQGILLTSMVAAAIFTLLYLPSTFPPSVNRYWFSTIVFAAIMVSVIFFGFLSDKVGRRPLMMIGAFLILCCSYSLFQWLQHPSITVFLLFGIVYGFIIGISNGCYACMLVELFPTRIRYTGMALAYNISFAIFGGLTPFVDSALQSTLGHYFSPAYLLEATAVLTLLAAYTLPREQFRQSLKCE